MIKRLIPLLCGALLCCTFLLPLRAHAASYGSYDVRSYSDFITDIEFGEDRNTVYLTLPVETSLLRLAVNGQYAERTFEGTLDYSVPPSQWPSSGKTASLFIYPTTFFYDFADLPDDAIFIFNSSWEFSGNFPSYFLTTSNVYVGKDNLVPSGSSYTTSRDYRNPVSLTPHFDDVRDVYEYAYSCSIPKSEFTSSAVAGSFFLNPMFNFVSNISNYTVNFHVEVQACTCQVSISSLQELERETGKTNLILQLLLNKLDDMQEENVSWFQTINESIQYAIRRICDNVYAINRFIQDSWHDITDGFASVVEAISNITTGFVQGTPAMQQSVAEFKSWSGSVKTSLQSASASLSALSTPDLNYSGSLDSFLLTPAFLSYSSVFNEVWEQPTLLQMALLMGSLLGVGMILFGKRSK